MSKEARLTKYKTILVDNNIARLKRQSRYYCQENRLYLCGLDKVVWIATEILQIDKENDEYIYMICLDTKLRARSVFEISHGGVNGSVCNPREIFQKALLANAVTIILIHNHPSGDPTPSALDISATKRIEQAGLLIGVSLIDHVIIGKARNLSLFDLGYIRNDLGRNAVTC